MNYLSVTLLFFSFLGANVKRNCENEKMILTGPSTMNMGCEVVIDSINFIVVYNDSNHIEFQQTNDSFFLTPEKMSISSTFEEVKELGVSGVVKKSGWGFEIQFNSGWIAVFRTGSLMTSSMPSMNQNVTFFYRR